MAKISAVSAQKVGTVSVNAGSSNSQLVEDKTSNERDMNLGSENLNKMVSESSGNMMSGN